MLFAEAGLIFGVPAEQQQCATCFLHVSYMFLSPQLSLITFKWSEHGAVFSVRGNVKPGVDPERSDYRTLRAERGTCFNPLQALITSPSAD